MWTSLNKKMYLFLGIIFAIGLALGFVFLIYLDESSKELIFLNINEWIQNLSGSHINNILSHLVILSSLCLLSIFIVGLPLVLFFVFYSGFSLGFMLMSLINIFGVKGFLYGLVYIIITKSIYLFFSLILVTSFLKLSIIILKKIFQKDKWNRENINILIKRILLCIATILIFDVILYFGGAKLITLFNFLLN